MGSTLDLYTFTYAVGSSHKCNTLKVSDQVVNGWKASTRSANDRQKLAEHKTKHLIKN